MMKEIKRINVLSTAKVYGLSMAMIGLVIGVFLGFLMFFVGDFLGSEKNYAPLVAPSLGVLGFLLMPILYGLLGFIFSGLTALIYNIIASWVGGIKIEFADTDNEDTPLEP
jgi:hypothetical protein